MKTTRKLSLLLALTMLASVACGTASSDETPDTVNSDTITAEVVTESLEEKLEVPEDLEASYKEFNILSTPSGGLSSADELTDDMNVLQQSLYERTRAVEEFFGIDITYTDIKPWEDVSKQARQSISAGADDHQIVSTCATHQVVLINEGFYLPISELPYVDLDKPWWNKEYIESVSILAEEPYFLFGDITYNMLQRTVCVIFNINLLEEKLNMKPQDLYELVYDGKWTIDKFTELVQSVYEDTNGNTVNDADDIHGLSTWVHYQMEWMAYSSGLEFTTRDENGYPVLNLYNNDTVALAEKLCKLFHNTDSVFDYKDNGGHAQAFADGKALFFMNRFFTFEWIRDMQDDYGVLPMPKYSEDIDGYHSTVEELVQWCAVPVTVADPTYVSAVAEVFSYYSRELTTPAYFENTLKLKLTRDDESMAMVDLIMNNRDTDFLFINRLEKLGDVFKNLSNAGQNNFASNYASRESAGKTALATLIQTFEDARN